MADFETEYQHWMDMHMRKRKGERLRMLKEQHGFGEKLLLQEIWWPVAGSLAFLHPEYEVIDEDGNYYYLDFAYMRFPKPTDLESDGFATHARDADRRGFTKGRRRQNAVALGGWNILRFSIDDLKEDPEHCRKTLRRMLERWYGEEPDDWSNLPLQQRELLRLAARSTKPVRPSEAAECLGAGKRLAIRLLGQLVEKGLLEPASGDKRIHSYRLVQRKKGRTKFRQ